MFKSIGQNDLLTNKFAAARFNQSSHLRDEQLFEEKTSKTFFILGINQKIENADSIVTNRNVA